MLPWDLGDRVSRDEVKRPVPSSRHLDVGELVAVDGPEAGAVAFLQVAALAQEVWDDVVEDGALEGDRVVLGAEDAEVLCRQGDLVPVQIDLDPVLLDAGDGDVQEHTRVRLHLLRRGRQLLLAGVAGRNVVAAGLQQASAALESEVVVQRGGVRAELVVRKGKDAMHDRSSEATMARICVPSFLFSFFFCPESLIKEYTKRWYVCRRE